MACTATATKSIMKEVVSTLEMHEFVTVSLSRNQPNIMHEVKSRTEPEADFSDLLTTSWEKLIFTPSVIVYCQTLMMCADLFAHFSYEMDHSTEAAKLVDGLSGTKIRLNLIEVPVNIPIDQLT